MMKKLITIICTILCFMTLSGCQSNKQSLITEPLAQKLYDARNKYVGDMPANNKLANLLQIQNQLGAYKNQLQTTTEPFGWTFIFQNPISQEKEDAFNQKMSQYTYVLLALTENLGEVSWTYSLEADTNSPHTQTVTCQNAADVLEKDIKAFNHSPETVQELLVNIDFE